VSALWSMAKVKECVCVHIGQAGCQVGFRCWELFTTEHGIQPDGTRTNDPFDGIPDDGAYQGFFHDTGTGQHVPRSIFVDTEPSVIDDIRISSMGNMFHPDSMLAFKKDARNNYFEGRRMAAELRISDAVMDRVRLAMDLCSNAQGFFVFHSFGGGTGSGVGVKILDDLRDLFPKKSIIQPVIYPSKSYSSTIVEPYNCIFATHESRETVDLSLMMDNEAAYNVCKKNLQLKNPHFKDVNRLLAQCISGCTGPLRYETELNATLDEIRCNLVPVKGFRYPIMCLAPVRHRERKSHEKFKTAEVVAELFDEKNLLCDCKGLDGNRYLAAVVMMRGEGRGDGPPDPEDAGGPTSTMGMSGTFKPISANAVMSAINSLRHVEKGSHKRPIKFVPWMEGSGVKIGIVKAHPVVPPNFIMAKPERQGVMLGNNTAVRQLFARQYIRYLRLMYHKAYIWQFMEASGEEDLFLEARESVRDIMDMYEDLMKQSVDAENEAQEQPPLREVKLFGASQRERERAR